MAYTVRHEAAYVSILLCSHGCTCLHAIVMLLHGTQCSARAHASQTQCAPVMNTVPSLFLYIILLPYLMLLFRFVCSFTTPVRVIFLYHIWCINKPSYPILYICVVIRAGKLYARGNTNILSGSGFAGGCGSASGAGGSSSRGSSLILILSRLTVERGFIVCG